MSSISRFFSLGKDPQTRPLEGLRVLFSYLVVTGHTTMFAPLMLDSVEPLRRLRGNAFLAIFAIVHSVFFLAAVDFFYFASGFLLVRSITTKLSLSDIFLKLFGRWLRLIPVYLFAAAVLASRGRSQCISISEVFFMHNIFSDAPPPHLLNPCVPVGWSIAVDFQAHILILFLLYFHPKAYKTFWFVITASCIFRLVTWYTMGKGSFPRGTSVMYFLRSREEVLAASHQMGIPAGNFDPSDEFFTSMRNRLIAYEPRYSGFWFRFAGVFAGAVVALEMRKNGFFYRTVKKNIYLSLCVTAVAWAGYGCAIVLLSSSQVKLEWFVAIIEGFGRMILTGGIAVVVMATCGDGVKSRLIQSLRDVLGHEVSVVMGRLTYALYLLHPLTLRPVIESWPRLSKHNFTNKAVWISGWKWWLVSMLCAIPVCLAEEVALVARKFVLRRLRAWTKKHDD